MGTIATTFNSFLYSYFMLMKMIENWLVKCQKYNEYCGDFVEVGDICEVKNGYIHDKDGEYITNFWNCRKFFIPVKKS